MSLRELSTAEAETETIVGDADATYSNTRCCPDSGICAITYRDTTGGVINNLDNADHCHFIDATTGSVINAGDEITNGELFYTPPSDGGTHRRLTAGHNPQENGGRRQCIAAVRRANGGTKGRR